MNFFEPVLGYFREKGWEPPGTTEQFAEAIQACWGASLFNSDDGQTWVSLPPVAQLALGLLPQSLN